MIQVNILRKHTPVWVIFFVDLIIVLFSIYLAYLLRFNFVLPPKDLHNLRIVIPLYIIVRSISFYFGKTYAGIVRYTSTEDAERIFLTMFSGTIVLTGINFINFYLINGSYIIPFSVLIIDLIASIFILISFRFMVKIIYHEFDSSNKEKTNIIIYGTNNLGIVTKRTLDRDAGARNKVVAFIDNTTRNVKKKLEGVSIYHSDSLGDILQKYNVAKLIIAKKYISPNRKKEIIEICLNYNVDVLTVPPIEKWINGELSFNQIKTVKIEDLLERSPIILDVNQIKNNIINRVILVTGAAGSIGSEIVRQLTTYNPARIVLVDKAESQLYDLELELKEYFNFENFKSYIGNITDESRMEWIFQKTKPGMVFHAAAYKHVPVMEIHPDEAVKNNVLGTKIIADLADKYGASKFVMVSTDKAVNPTNVMGASKRIAEIYIQTLNKKSNTNYITTRFGNVLDSVGSVIPRFRKQIERGGPVTVTHPEITRFFMTISEACRLVLEAGAMGQGGEIYVFDMGRPVKIVDLAKKMIKLSGLEIGKDIQLQFTGLRPGEKLYEELLKNNENNLPTHNKMIMIAKVIEYEDEKVKTAVAELINLAGLHDSFKIVSKMKGLVPEFVSKNSVFEELDTNKKG